jgi:hypothetical protein
VPKWPRFGFCCLFVRHLCRHAHRATSQSQTNPIPAARSVTLTVQSAPGGASLSALKEGKSKSEQMSIRNQDMTLCRRVRNDQLATLKRHGGRRRRPSGLWSICVSGDRCGDPVSFSLSTRRQCNGGRQAERDRQKSRQFLPAQASCRDPGTRPELRLPSSQLDANNLCGRNSAGSAEICATFQRDILRRHF